MNSPRRTVVSHGVAALWASAFVLAGLILTQAATLPIAESQQSGTVSTVEELTVLTVSTGSGEDIVLVLDGLADSLFAYGVQNRQSIELIQSYDIGRLFLDARNASGLPARP